MSSKQFVLPDPHSALTDELIMAHVNRGSRVIDLGCGDGRLIEKLRDEHDCDVVGVELDLDQLIGSVQRGVPVIRADLDQGLQGIPDESFDVAVISETLQEVRHPKDVLDEIFRIAHRALVVVPNFAYWRVRMQVAWQGRTPVTPTLKHEWFDSPNVRFLSMLDFRDLAKRGNFRIVHELPIIGNRAVQRAWLANFRAHSALFVLERPDNANRSHGESNGGL